MLPQLRSPPITPFHPIPLLHPFTQSQNQDFLACPGGDGRVHVWDSFTGKRLWSVQGPPGCSTAAVMSANHFNHWRCPEFLGESDIANPQGLMGWFGLAPSKWPLQCSVALAAAAGQRIEYWSH